MTHSHFHATCVLLVWRGRLDDLLTESGDQLFALVQRDDEDEGHDAVEDALQLCQRQSTYIGRRQYKTVKNQFLLTIVLGILVIGQQEEM